MGRGFYVWPDASVWDDHPTGSLKFEGFNKAVQCAGFAFLNRLSIIGSASGTNIDYGVQIDGPGVFQAPDCTIAGVTINAVVAGFGSAAHLEGCVFSSCGASAIGVSCATGSKLVTPAPTGCTTPVGIACLGELL